MKKDQRLRGTHPHLERTEERLNADPGPPHCCQVITQKVSTMPLSFCVCSVKPCFLGPTNLSYMIFFSLKLRSGHVFGCMLGLRSRGPSEGGQEAVGIADLELRRQVCTGG